MDSTSDGDSTHQNVQDENTQDENTLDEEEYDTMAFNRADYEYPDFSPDKVEHFKERYENGYVMMSMSRGFKHFIQKTRPL